MGIPPDLASDLSIIYLNLNPICQSQSEFLRMQPLALHTKVTLMPLNPMNQQPNLFNRKMSNFESVFAIDQPNRYVTQSSLAEPV